MDTCIYLSLDVTCTVVVSRLQRNSLQNSQKVAGFVAFKTETIRLSLPGVRVRSAGRCSWRSHTDHMCSASTAALLWRTPPSALPGHLFLEHISS